MTAFCNKAERFFLVFLWINPFLDILSGGWLLASEKAALPSVTPSLVIRMARTIIFPAAMRYQGELANTAARLREIGMD